ncbi:hypothetical protein LCGC14_0113420 [marine sediment metagenome]|uniref:Uncharacterized protein n=2 Tax=root TaxID=1 RepID=A0A7V1FM82_9RHOB|nr:hypothetical protein [Sulfitobacter litoralis]HDZ51391.1 hypothetical protein [Sulfitobacter litoralis]
MTDTNTTTIIIAQPPKSAWAAFFLTFFFGPLGLLYASIAGGIILTVIALIIVPLTAGIAAFVIWPISMIWGVLAALASKNNPADAA